MQNHSQEILSPSERVSSGVSPIVMGAVIAGGATLLSASRSARAAVNPPLTFADIPGTGDIKVLNYALALEVLEADLYDQALKRLTSGGTNAAGTTIPGLNISESEPDVEYTLEFRQVEIDHRDFLKGAIGSGNIADGAFANATFDFNIQNLSRQQVVELLQTVEALGTSAYLGAIPFFATRRFLQIAAAIQGTEARHTAVITAIKNRLFNTTDPVAPLFNQNNGIDQPIAPNDVLAQASAFINL